MGVSVKVTLGIANSHYINSCLGSLIRSCMIPSLDGLIHSLYIIFAHSIYMLYIPLLIQTRGIYAVSPSLGCSPQLE